ncbi:MAG: DUF108 domain-containing protein [Hyphomonadaceae bacterium]|nr:DUF108 domain-containing protein [Hyphomonadaceae bacterium]
MSGAHPLRVGIAGIGAVGGSVLKALQTMPQFKVAGVVGETVPVAMETLDRLGESHHLAMEIGELAECSDVVVEAAPADAFLSIARPALARARTLVVLSAAGLLDVYDSVTALLAQQQQGRLILASGAIGGLDVVKAAASGAINACRLVTIKPAAALASAPWVTDHGIDLANLDGRLLVFSGTAREASQAFPANANVAATLALAGPGPERVAVEIWADPVLDRNVHEIRIDGDFGEMSVIVRGRPEPGNPRTSRLAAASVLAVLRDLTSHIRFGT